MSDSLLPGGFCLELGMQYICLSLEPVPFQRVVEVLEKPRKSRKARARKAKAVATAGFLAMWNGLEVVPGSYYWQPVEGLPVVPSAPPRLAYPGNQADMPRVCSNCQFWSERSHPCGYCLLGVDRVSEDVAQRITRTVLSWPLIVASDHCCCFYLQELVQ